MARYFFDVVSEKGRTHDYQGCDFPNLDGARRQGELIALDLMVEQESEGRVCGKVSVCDVQGRELFAIPVQGQALGGG
jgi:hypothetical protein